MRLLLLLVTVASAADLKLTPAWTYDTRDSTEAAKGGGKRPALEVTPVYEGGRLHISTPWGTVAALEATTGREIWRVDLKVNPKGGYGDFASRGVSLRGGGCMWGPSMGCWFALRNSMGRIVLNLRDRIVPRACGGGRATLANTT